ncbi:MAG TPA: cation diffusion facilitator family transporter [Gemmatimonadaceae bacterium]|nr:cation diffusion facilitator family transporter [Gemmatimonadaceae bacterium]
MGHGGHHHGSGDSARLRLALAITATLLIAEVIGGIVSNSIALLADAGHMLTDVAALGLSLFVAWFAHLPRTSRRTYGYLRWEILAALINGVTLLLLSAWIIWESVARFNDPEPITGRVMLIIAVMGLIANLAAARVLHPASGSSLNVRGAYLHVLGDLLASVGTVVAALVIWKTGWLAADPLASLLTTALIIRGAWNLVRESVDVLLESAPAHIVPAEVRARLEAIPGLESLHDLHVWSVSSGMVAMSAHAVVNDPERHQPVLEQAQAEMKSFGIEHVTIQLERHDMASGESRLHQLDRRRS